jgi:hypothetical protein
MFGLTKMDIELTQSAHCKNYTTHFIIHWGEGSSRVRMIVGFTFFYETRASHNYSPSSIQDHGTGHFEAPLFVNCVSDLWQLFALHKFYCIYLTNDTLTT